MLSNKLKQNILEVILPKYACRKLILFGSHARATANNKSDIDLLVVVDSPKSRFDLMDKILAELTKLNYPFDVVVQSTKEFERDKNYSGTLARYASKEGVMLYER